MRILLTSLVYFFYLHIDLTDLKEKKVFNKIIKYPFTQT